MKMFSYKVQLVTALTLLIGGLAFLYFFTGVFGGSEINVTITTNPDLKNGLVGHWTFDGKDLINNATDISGQGNHGYLTSFTSTTTVPGRLGQGLQFDGSDDAITVANNMLQAGNVSVSAWIVTDTVTAEERCIALAGNGMNSNSYGMCLNETAGKLNVRWGTDALGIQLTGNTTLSTGVWYHVVFTRSGSSGDWLARLFVNGQDDGSASTAVDPNDAGTEFAIGTHGGFPSLRFFDGFIDDVRVYNRALSTTEIKRLYELGATTYTNTTITTNPNLTQGLVGHWTFDGNLNTTVTDRSGQGNSGYLSGVATTSATTQGAIGQALRFDGSDDIVQVQDPGAGSVYDFDDGNEITMALWVRPDSFASFQTLFGKHTPGSADFNYLIQLVNGVPDFLFTGLGFNQYRSSQTLRLNEWTHIAFTYTVANGASQTFYINGVKDTGATQNNGDGNNSPTPANGPIMFGANDYAAPVGTLDEPFAGRLDDIRLYSRTLSADEIKRLYELGATTYVNTTITTNPDLKTGLVGHWTFDGKDLKNNATDISGQGNHGYLTNFTSTTTVPGRIGQALEFDGCSGCAADDDVDVGSAAVLDNMEYITVSAWIYMKPGSDAPAQTIIEKNGGSNVGWTFLSHNTSRYLTFSVEYTGDEAMRRTSNNIIEHNSWNHVVATFASTSLASDIHIYINGIEASSYPTFDDGTEPRQDDNARSVKIGDGGVSSNFNGPIDDVRIYNRALTAGEIKRLYELGR